MAVWLLCQIRERWPTSGWSRNVRSSSYIATQRQIADMEHRALVYGVVPITRAQQEELALATKGPVCKSPVAIVTPSNAIVFIATMFTLLNRNVSFFAPNQYGKALAHLGFTPEESEAVTRSYDRLMDLFYGEPRARDR